MKFAIKKLEDNSVQCSLCSAKFEIWLNNARLSEEKKEKISQHLLSYCPVCKRADEKYKF